MGYSWKNGIPEKSIAKWKPDVAVGRYFTDEHNRELNNTPHELLTSTAWKGLFVPLVVISCKTRVSTSEFYDTRARFEIIRKVSPYTLTLELANKNKIASEHLKAEGITQNAYFLEEGVDSLERFFEDIREHIKNYG